MFNLFHCQASERGTHMNTISTPRKNISNDRISAIKPSRSTSENTPIQTRTSFIPQNSSIANTNENTSDEDDLSEDVLCSVHWTSRILYHYQRLVHKVRCDY